ncbi:MAG TPA: hypothetical protein DEB39_06280 [Planctomycetaceae bacterium]|nr:hypothetical protein [Planctomycetaceae bacterium]
MKNQKIVDPLLGVNRRRRIQRMTEWGTWGLLVGSSLAFLCILESRFVFSLVLSPWVLLITGVVSGSAIGVVTALFFPLDTKEAARRVDTYYQLKDRLLTALKLLALRESTPMERLQIEDAAHHAEAVDPKAVVPYRLPRNFAWGLVSFLLTLALVLALSLFQRHHEAVAALPIPEIVATVESLKEELLKKIEELSEEHGDEQPLKELSQELEKLLGELEESSNDPREALATLSKMETAVRSAMNEFDLEAVDASMREVAEALSASDATRSTSDSLKAGEYAKAAESLEKLDPQSLGKQDRTVLSEQMQQAGKSMNKRGQAELARSTLKMSDALRENNAAECKGGACELAGLCRKQGLRKGICKGLESKLALLSLCKSECNGSSCANNGGMSTNKSDSPSNNWGRGTAGNPASGEETSLEGNREQQQLTGMPGAGESEFEQFRSEEIAKESSAAAYKERFQEFRKMSEEVLESEPIPLGQRQMIRRYFESIRPREER